MIHELFEPGGVDRVTSDIRNAGPWGFLILLAIQFLQIVVAFIPGEVVQVAAGDLRALGGRAHHLARLHYLELVHLRAGAQVGRPVRPGHGAREVHGQVPRLGDLRQVQRHRVHPVPHSGLPKDVFTYITPLTHMSMKNFVLISNFARIPGIVLSTYAAAGLVSGNIVESVIIFAVTAAVAIVALVVYGRVTKSRTAPEK